MTTQQNKIRVNIVRLEGMKERKLLDLNAERVRCAGMYLVSGGQPTGERYTSALEYTLASDVEALQYGIEAIKLLTE